MSNTSTASRPGAKADAPVEFESAIRKLLRRPIAMHPAFIDLLGTHSAAAFLSQAFFYETAEDIEKREFRGCGGGWWYHSYEDWFRDARLTRSQVDRARQLCQSLHILEEKRGDHHGKLYFRLKLSALLQLLNERKAEPEGNGERSTEGRTRTRRGRKHAAARVRKTSTLRVQETSHLRPQENGHLRVQETSHLHGLENTDPENDRREKKGKTEEGALRAGANAPTAPPAPASKPQHEAPQNSGGVPQPVETYRAVHRRYPSKKQTAKQREEGLPNDWEQIAAAVLPQEDAAWRAALESWRDTAIEHNLSLALGERRWNPAGVDSALRAFAEAQAVRDYQQRAHAAAQAKPAAEKPAAGGVRSFGSGGVSLNIAAPRQ